MEILKEYKLFTNKGSIGIIDVNDKEALRLALDYCCREGLEFYQLSCTSDSNPYTLCIAKIDKNNLISTL